MTDPAIAAELPRFRRACFAVAIAAALFASIHVFVAANLLLNERNRAYFWYQFPPMALGIICLAGVVWGAVLAARRSEVDGGWPTALRYFSRATTALSVFLIALLALLTWVSTRPVY